MVPIVFSVQQHGQQMVFRWEAMVIPANKVGLIYSMFRPSDDATVFPFLIPSNYFALESLLHLQELGSKIGNATNLVSGAADLGAN
jgi:meiotically up-regulated gene 157 (Mug157) protein